MSSSHQDSSQLDRPTADRPTADRLHGLIDAMRDRPVLMAADLVADRFIHGTPKRISREAPVLILRWDGETVTPGGGANAVANVASLGGRPLVLGVVGDDLAGRELLGELAERGVETSGILVHADYRTPTKTRVLAGARHAIKQQIVRFDVEDELHLDAALRTDLLERLDALLQSTPDPLRAAVLSDYGYGAIVPSLTAEIRARVGDECMLLGDSRYRLAEFCDPQAGVGLDGATPNAEEAEGLLGRDLPSEDLAAGRDLRERLGCKCLLITLGSDGMALHTAAGSARLPVHGTDQVADVTGAGDTVIATFALSLAAGASPLEATCLANYAGGIVVMKMGTAVLAPEELHSAVEQGSGLLEEIRWDR